MAAIDEPPPWAAEFIRRADDSGENIESAVAIAVDLGSRLPLPGHGETFTRWAVLAALGRANLTVARVVEAHTDALAILDEAGQPRPSDLSWGVFAAEAPGARLDAKISGEGWQLTGEKPWCSLGDQLNAAREGIVQ